MAVIRMVGGGTANVKANTVAELRDIWQAALKGGHLMVIGSSRKPEGVINPAHIVMISES